MAQANSELLTGEGVVADSGGQAAWTLPVLRSQRQHAERQSLLSVGVTTDFQVVEPPQSATIVQLGELLCVFEALPATGAPHRSQLVHTVARNVSFTEEPDVGNLQVRFREGY